VLEKEKKKNGISLGFAKLDAPDEFESVVLESVHSHEGD